MDVTVSISNSSMFSAGDVIVFDRGWPKWMYLLHVPIRIRLAVRWTFKRQDKWGPSEPMKITKVTSSNTLKVR